MEKVKFHTMYYQEARTGQDLSNEYEDVYTEIAPYAKDENGKFINDTSEPILKKTGRVNIQEKIQSFADECDIYKILEKAALAGTDLRYKEDQAVDLSAIPTNYNDYNDWIKRNYDFLSKMPKDIASTLLKDDFDIEAYNEAVKAYNEKNVKKEVKEEVKSDDKKEESSK